MPSPDEYTDTLESECLLGAPMLVLLHAPVSAVAFPALHACVLRRALARERTRWKAACRAIPSPSHSGESGISASAITSQPWRKPPVHTSPNSVGPMPPSRLRRPLLALRGSRVSPRVRRLVDCRLLLRAGSARANPASPVQSRRPSMSAMQLSYGELTASIPPDLAPFCVPTFHAAPTPTAHVFVRTLAGWASCWEKRSLQRRLALPRLFLDLALTQP